ncbi:MAG: phosphomannomutase [Rhodobacterales bacterium 65-51]|uniref:phosphomannomutase n=1 Tax=uncultured Gemmobacter sp. TaxID=1095917 RepID=UPI000968C384|nr:phosphomannomutase [uncultured Gemmobacter sp.]OJY28909.1 MAG: phosphomannomutase [Rhodobacterales bacterium 65-51]
MAPKFGTSGLRGLVSELTPGLVTDYVRAFVTACPAGTALWVGRDLRPSSPALAATVLEAARGMGLETVDCGAVPTPALALAAMKAGASAVMVTGSHIPADRNGLKFYLPGGEITKADETAILRALGAGPATVPGPQPRPCTTAGSAWVARYVTAFGPGALAGLRIGVWSHSAVSRDLLLAALAALGAEGLDLGRSDLFIPVDTEAVAPEARAALRVWARDAALDAVISTDGDGDRPLLADAGGRLIPGDVLGQITAAVLGAETVVTPVSSNTGVDAGGRFRQVIRTRIGSPHVIAGMAAAGGRVVGYEANGGFLLGFAAQGPAGPLPPLATRDSLLPLVAVLSRARLAGGLAALVAAEPARFTAADRLEEVPPEAARALLAGFGTDPGQLEALLGTLGESCIATDRTDGLRLTLASGRVVHMRPSGNAPEFRLYVEAESPERAEGLLRQGLDRLSHLLRGLSSGAGAPDRI